MKFTKKILVETLNKKSNGEKTFTDGKKQNIIIMVLRFIVMVQIQSFK